MDNLVEGNIKEEFYVWLDPNDALVKHNIETTGFLKSHPAAETSDLLPFLKNPNSEGIITPFTYNIISEYRIEYNYELTREKFFPKYPSRLAALFLFENKEEATKYQRTHGHHVYNRKLIKVESVDDYKYSVHDIGWTDALYKPGGQDATLRERVTKNYWNGISVQGQEVGSFGKYELLISNNEILYLGTVRLLDEL